MRILHIMNDRHRAGTEEAFMTHCRIGKKHGDSIFAMVTKQCQYKKELKDLDVPFSVMPKRRFWNLTFKRTIQEMVAQYHPDIILLHGSGPSRLFRKIPLNVPTLVITHTYNVKQMLQYDGIIALTEDLKLAVCKVGALPHNVFVVPNMFIKPPITHMTQPFSLNPIPIIGALGRFRDIKGFDILIDAMAILKKRNVPCKAVIAGDGKDEQTLQKHIVGHGLENIVALKEWVSGEAKEAFYNSIDILCVPSRSEPFGLVTLEGFAYQRPVIATHTQGPKEIITPHETGLLFEKENPENLANCIEALCHDHQKAIILGQKGEASLTRYHPDTIWPQLKQVFESFIKH